MAKQIVCRALLILLDDSLYSMHVLIEKKEKIMITTFIQGKLLKCSEYSNPFFLDEYIKKENIKNVPEDWKQNYLYHLKSNKTINDLLLVDESLKGDRAISSEKWKNIYERESRPRKRNERTHFQKSYRKIM